jgi:hypothetical protein
MLKSSQASDVIESAFFHDDESLLIRHSESANNVLPLLALWNLVAPTKSAAANNLAMAQPVAFSLVVGAPVVENLSDIPLLAL